jgi:dTDP-glucose pyrophosphorylase
MKALILAAGRGSRFGKTAERVNKCMLTVAGKPLVEYSLQCAAGLKNIDKIVVVVGYKADDIMNRYAGAFNKKPISYVRQKTQQGLVQAIECAKPAIEGDDFMLMLGDEFMVNPYHRTFVEEFLGNSELFGLCGVVRVKDKDLVKKTYAVIQSQDSRIYRLIEKPNNPPNAIMGTGNCVFKNGIFSYIEATPINQKRKEKELPDLIQCAIDDGHIIKSFIISEEYVNVNSPKELDKTKSYFSHW